MYSHTQSRVVQVPKRAFTCRPCLSRLSYMACQYAATVGLADRTSFGPAPIEHRVPPRHALQVCSGRSDSGLCKSRTSFPYCIPVRHALKYATTGLCPVSLLLHNSTMSIWAPAVWMEQWFVMVPAPFVLAEGSGEYFCTLSMR